MRAMLIHVYLIICCFKGKKLHFFLGGGGNSLCCIDEFFSHNFASRVSVFILIEYISILSFCSGTADRFNWFPVHCEHIIHLGPRGVPEV